MTAEFTSANNYVAVDYITSGGPRNAAAVVKGETHLAGVVIDDGLRPPVFERYDIAGALRRVRDRTCVFYDRVFSLAVEWFHYLPMPPVVEDIRIMHHLLQEQPPTVLLPKVSSAGNQDVRARTDQIRSSYPDLRWRIEDLQLGTVYQQVELPVVAPTLLMIVNGVRIDLDRLQQIVNEHDRLLQSAVDRLHSLVGHPLNVQDGNAVARYLYDDLELPVPGLTAKGNPSITVECLEQIAGCHAAVPAIVEVMRLRTIRNSAAQILDHVSADGLVHADLDTLGAETGRFTCSVPNLHGLDRRLREVVIAAPGHVLIEADISQAEMRVLAHLSGDATLAAVFHADGDVHRFGIAAALGTPAEQVTPDERELGKRLNFSLIYGASPEGVARALGVSYEQAENVLATFFRTYPGVQQWLRRVQESAAQNGYTRTMYGRRRRLLDFWSGNPARAYRQAVNTAVQGSAAELMKLALAELPVALPREASLLLTVHDSVLVQAPCAMVAEVRQVLTDVMQTPPTGFTVPIKAHTGVGQTWAECKSSAVC